MLIFCSFFILIFLIGYLFWRKQWPLMSFIIFFPILPDYFALPLKGISMTGSRLLILILFIYFLLHKNKFSRFMTLIKNTFFRITLSFITIIVLINFYHWGDNSDSGAMIVQIIFEQLLVLSLLALLINTEDKLLYAFKMLSKTSLIISLFALIESIFRFNLFYFLKTVESGALQTSYERAGILRAEVGFGHPVYFGFYSVLLFVTSLFLYKYTKQNIYRIISIFNILSIFLSGTRGSIVCLIIVVTMILLFSPSWLNGYYKLIPFLIIILIITVIINSNIAEYFIDLLKSILNFFGANYEISGFGTNLSGGKSRIAQLSLFEYLRNTDNLLFGLGAKAQVKELIYYKYDGLWQQSNTYDIGYLSYLGNYGLIGFISYLVYIFLWCFKSFSQYLKSRKSSSKVISFYFIFFIITYFINLFNSVGINSIFWMITAFFISYSKSKELKKIEK